MMKRTASLLVTGLVILALTAAGCAGTLLYNHADWLIVRQLDGYFDLSRTQKAFVYEKLDGILERHRYEALPRYEAIIQDLDARVRRGLSEQDVAWGLAQYDVLKADLFGRFSGDGAEFVRQVRAPQVERLRRALDSRLQREEPLLRDRVEVRLKKRCEKILALVHEWLGSATPQQEEEISRLVMEFPDTFPAWYANQRMRNDRLVALIASGDSSETAARLHDWLVEQEKDADPQFVQAARLLRQHVARLILTIDRIATPEQRRYFLAKVEDLRRTIHRLSQA